MVLDHGVEVVNCVEFDVALRELDVADDLAFLVLDISARGAPRLAELLIDHYRSSGGDPAPPSSIAFYAAYRALVRANVELLGGGGAERRIALAESFAWRARRPLVIAVCGVPASGKSHLAAALARAADLPHLRSDTTRKRLAGVAPGDHAPASAYAEEFDLQTYRELARETADALSARGGAIVDATFRRLRDRCAFMGELSIEPAPLFVECRAPAALLIERARARQAGGDISDADEQVVARERESWEALDEIDSERHLTYISE